MSLTIEGDALARVAFNALTFVPKSARERFIRVTLSADAVEIAATDGYAAGKDKAPAHDGPGQPLSFGLSREDLEAVESVARGWKKYPVSISPTPTGLALSGPDQPVFVERLPLHAEAWELLDGLYSRTEQAGQPLAGAVAFDPNLFAKFGKVKAPSGRVADYLFRGPELPVLVKVGPSFVGLVMPLQRERAEAYEPEGLW